MYLLEHVFDLQSLDASDLVGVMESECLYSSPFSVFVQFYIEDVC